MLHRLVVPSRFALICRSGQTLGYNPGLNTWERLDEATAEVIRWLRAKRNLDDLEAHLARRFGYTAAAANEKLRKIMHWCILRRMLYLDREPELVEDGSPTAPPLISVYWICTQACNLRCTYCYQKATVACPNELTTAEGKALVDQAADAGVRVFVFTGGEPFSRRDLLEIARHARNRELVTNVITNGHYVHDENIKEIAETFNRVTISLDHGVAEHHDRNRGRGSWARAASAIDLLLEAGAKVDINSTLSQFGLEDVDELLRFVRKRRIGVHRIVPQYPMGRGAHMRDDELTPTQLLTLDDQLHQINQDLDDDLDDNEQGTLQLEGSSTDKKVRRNHCGAGLGEVAVDPEGWVYPCKLLQYPQFRAGNIRSQPLAQIFGEHSMLRTARQRTVDTLERCKSCIIKNHCGGGCRGIHFSFTYDIIKSAPLFCAYLRSSFETRAWDSTGEIPAPRKTEFREIPVVTGQSIPEASLGMVNARN